MKDFGRISVVVLPVGMTVLTSSVQGEVEIESNAHLGHVDYVKCK